MKLTIAIPLTLMLALRLAEAQRYGGMIPRPPTQKSLRMARYQDMERRRVEKTNKKDNNKKKKDKNDDKEGDPPPSDMALQQTTTTSDANTPRLSSQDTPEPTESPTMATSTFFPTSLSPTTVSPTGAPSQWPSERPTQTPSKSPSASPTTAPSLEPSSSEPTSFPTARPSSSAPTFVVTTMEPTLAVDEVRLIDSMEPLSVELTGEPTRELTKKPTDEPTVEPTREATAEPTDEPTSEPTEIPTSDSPTTDSPTSEPTRGQDDDDVSQAVGSPPTASPTGSGSTLLPTVAGTREEDVIRRRMVHIPSFGVTLESRSDVDEDALIKGTERFLTDALLKENPAFEACELFVERLGRRRLSQVSVYEFVGEAFYVTDQVNVPQPHEVKKLVERAITEDARGYRNELNQWGDNWQSIDGVAFGRKTDERISTDDSPTTDLVPPGDAPQSSRMDVLSIAGIVGIAASVLLGALAVVVMLKLRQRQREDRSAALKEIQTSTSASPSPHLPSPQELRQQLDQSLADVPLSVAWTTSMGGSMVDQDDAFSLYADESTVDSRNVREQVAERFGRNIAPSSNLSFDENDSYLAPSMVSSPQSSRRPLSTASLVDPASTVSPKDTNPYFDDDDEGELEEFIGSIEASLSRRGPPSIAPSDSFEI